MFPTMNNPLFTNVGSKDNALGTFEYKPNNKYFQKRKLGKKF